MNIMENLFILNKNATGMVTEKAFVKSHSNRVSVIDDMY